jgi:hypothetical protein
VIAADRWDIAERASIRSPLPDQVIRGERRIAERIAADAAL